METGYESAELLHQYLLFHYGSAQERMPWGFGPRMAEPFPVEIVRRGLDVERLPAGATALDVGCAVGRSTFELGRYVAAVTGIDYSDSFIMAARVLCREGAYTYPILETGRITTEGTARVPEGVECGRVHFEQGDAHALRAELGPVDVLLASNLLCRLHNPRAFLRQMAGQIKPGGQLIITTPHSWLEAFTAPSYWLGATPETGEPYEALAAALRGDFVCEHREDVPFVIREHRRKYQWSVAELTRWIRC